MLLPFFLRRRTAGAEASFAQALERIRALETQPWRGFMGQGANATNWETLRHLGRPGDTPFRKALAGLLVERAPRVADVDLGQVNAVANSREPCRADLRLLHFRRTGGDAPDIDPVGIDDLRAGIRAGMMTDREGRPRFKEEAWSGDLMACNHDASGRISALRREVARYPTVFRDCCVETIAMDPDAARVLDEDYAVIVLPTRECAAVAAHLAEAGITRFEAMAGVASPEDPRGLAEGNDWTVLALPAHEPWAGPVAEAILSSNIAALDLSSFIARIAERQMEREAAAGLVFTP